MGIRYLTHFLWMTTLFAFAGSCEKSSKQVELGDACAGSDAQSKPNCAKRSGQDSATTGGSSGRTSGSSSGRTTGSTTGSTTGGWNSTTGSTTGGWNSTTGSTTGGWNSTTGSTTGGFGGTTTGSTTGGLGGTTTGSTSGGGGRSTTTGGGNGGGGKSTTTGGGNGGGGNGGGGNGGGGNGGGGNGGGGNGGGGNGGGGNGGGGNGGGGNGGNGGNGGPIPPSGTKVETGLEASLDDKLQIKLIFTKNNAASFSDMTYSTSSLPLTFTKDQILGPGESTMVGAIKIDVVLEFKFPKDNVSGCTGNVSLTKIAEQLPVAVTCK